MEPIGIYIHIPFCLKKCRYCDFLSWAAGEEEQNRYTEYLVREIHGTKLFQGGVCREYENSAACAADSIFIGGGTPSLLSLNHIERIMEAVSDRFQLASSAEITLECNPGTAEFSKLKAYRRLGINRLSIGVQSAVERELKALGRVHSFEEAKTTFRLAREAGFANINVDLMSALPGQTVESYKKTLHEILRMEPEHISAYSLILEEGTPLYEQYCGVSPVEEDTDREMYSLTKELLARHGYERYEISNYAKKGYSCRHNLKYWSDGDYAGFGLGASSKIAHIRYKNESSMEKYEAGLRNGTGVAKVEEVLDKRAQMSEFFILGLRKTAGVSLDEFAERFLERAEQVYGKEIHRFIHDGLLKQEGQRLYLSERGLDLSNYVFCGFI
ncbi:MAG: radical SAM family heme chaperone HemW [Roseburia sp.]|nr:radical SAM family heme chaperone HemW [Roseburia sp.]